MDPATNYTLVGLLIAAISALWKQLLSDRKVNAEKHAKCETDYQAAVTRLHQIEMKQAVFEACSASPCPARDALQRQQQFFSSSTKQ